MGWIANWNGDNSRDSYFVMALSGLGMSSLKYQQIGRVIPGNVLQDPSLDAGVWTKRLCTQTDKHPYEHKLRGCDLLYLRPVRGIMSGVETLQTRVQILVQGTAPGAAYLELFLSQTSLLYDTLWWQEAVRNGKGNTTNICCPSGAPGATDKTLLPSTRPPSYGFTRTIPCVQYSMPEQTRYAGLQKSSTFYINMTYTLQAPELSR